MVSGILIGSPQPFEERFIYGKVVGCVGKYETLQETSFSLSILLEVGCGGKVLIKETGFLVK